MYSTIKSIFIISLISCLSISSGKSQASSNAKIIFLSDTSVNFNGLTAMFKGKIVYVDIWATWCAPCRKELQSERSVKTFQNFAIKNNIVILYICCDKQEDKWKPFVTANYLAGYHIMVNKYNDKEFHTTFSTIQNRMGIFKRSFYIPRHMIIDQYGAIVDSSADRQGSALVYLKINKILNKNPDYN